MKRKNLFIVVFINSYAFSQIGINTHTPQKTLHVNGSLQITNEFNVGGDSSTTGTAGVSGQVLTSNGPGQPPTWTNNSSGLGLKAGDYGSVIAVNGVLTLAQEIKVQMSNDFVINADATAIPIGNLNFEIIDNLNLYSGNATSNSFRVNATGAYEIQLNCQFQVQTVPNAQRIVVGIWDDTTNQWAARINDTVVGQFQTQSLLTTINMNSTHIYSIRTAVDITTTGTTTIKKLSSGVTGSGPVTQIVIKRIK